MLAVTGYNSRIVQDLRPLLPEGEAVVRAGRGNDFIWAERYLLCAGLLRPKAWDEQSSAEICESMKVNLTDAVGLCEFVLDCNPSARICVIGSESGFKGSYDTPYALAKAALHKYVETRKLLPDQQLVCVAPSIIADAKMTLDRTDTENLERRRLANPKRRFLKAIEVARMVHYLLYVDEGYTTGTVIRMNGGPAC